MTRRSSSSSGKTCAIAAANVPEGLERRLGWAGIVFVGLFAAAYAVAGPYPATDDTPADVARFYSERGRLLVAVVLSGAGIAAFIVFLGALRATLRRVEGEAGALSAIAVIAGSVLAAAGFVETALHGALAFRRGDLDTELVVTLFDAASLFFVLLAFPAAVLVAAASVAALETGALPRTLAYAGLAVAALQLPAGASVAESGAFSPSGSVPIAAFGVYLAWIAAASLAIVTGRPRAG